MPRNSVSCYRGLVVTEIPDYQPEWLCLGHRLHLHTLWEQASEQITEKGYSYRDPDLILILILILGILILSNQKNAT